MRRTLALLCISSFIVGASTYTQQAKATFITLIPSKTLNQSKQLKTVTVVPCPNEQDHICTKPYLKAGDTAKLPNNLQVTYVSTDSIGPSYPNVNGGTTTTHDTFVVVQVGVFNASNKEIIVQTDDFTVVTPSTILSDQNSGILPINSQRALYSWMLPASPFPDPKDLKSSIILKSDERTAGRLAFEIPKSEAHDLRLLFRFSDPTRGSKFYYVSWEI